MKAKHLGKKSTFLALKNQSSFAIGTTDKGLKVVDDGVKVFSGPFSESCAWLRDMISIKPINCYFLDMNYKLYRKNIDKLPPYPYMEIKCGNREGASFRYSDLHNWVIVIQDCNKISGVNLSKNEVEIEVEKSIGYFINDFRLFGRQQDRVVALTTYGYIFLYRLNYGEKSGCLI